MTPRPDSALNVYIRTVSAILSDADRELAPEQRIALVEILIERLRWLAADRPAA